jgi:hypothetical protein
VSKIQYFDVNEDDIKHGIATSCFNCPVARAIKRDLPWLNISVGSNFSVFRTGSKSEQYNHTTDLHNWIRTYDEYKENKPFRGYIDHDRKVIGVYGG